MSTATLRALRAAMFLCVCALPAAAADWYGELHAGATHSELSGSPGVADRDESAFGFGAGVTFNRYFSTQLDWRALGDDVDVATPPACLPSCIVILTTPIPEQGWTLRALPRLPLGERFALELGIGWMKWEGDYNYVGTKVSDSGTDSYYSLGVAWKFGDRWSATIEYQQLELDYYDFDGTSASLRYRF